MSAVDLSLNYEDLLQTVKESDRGRWFLTEFENRLRKSDTGNILASIAKLESVIAGMAPADAGLVARAKTAIAAARKEIAAIDQAKPELSDEARLFAKLADMARTSFSADGQPMTSVNAGVCRALLLVDQLDQDFASVSMPVVSPSVAAFARDADVFEPPVLAKPVIDVPKSAIKDAPKDIERGARLVIRKAGQEEPQQPEAAAVPEAPPRPATEPAAPAVAAPEAVVQPISPPVERQSRVVIIRRKPEELLDVPLVDQSQSESAA
ncbi:MAG: hypothetical protein GYA66_01955 [Phyllobacteriaceae bacterium]|nr:hypothetical protein [Phyllobacteriaceae bacterium]